MVQSLDTGKFYATARKASVTSTFNEETAKGLIGTKMPGVIKRVESDPYPNLQIIHSKRAQNKLFLAVYNIIYFIYR